MIAPFYQDSHTTIYCADCRDVLPLLTERAGLVVADPPYAEQTHQGARTAIDTTLLDFDSISSADLRACFDAIGAVAARWVVSFMDYRHAVAFEDSPPAHLDFIRLGVWTKPNAAPQFTGDRPGTGWEAIAHFHRTDAGRMRWNGGGRTAVYTYNKIHHDHRIGDNPTAKPLPLVAEIIRLFSDPGDLVLDPFMGTGTTIAAARLLGRRSIGIDTRLDQCEAAAAWCRQPFTRRRVGRGTTSGPTLFDMEEAA